MRLCVVGGDARALALRELLALEGYEAGSVGLAPGDGGLEAIARADALLLPFPRSAREGVVPTLTGLTLHARDALDAARAGATLLCGAELESELGGERLRDKRFHIRRYMDDEALLRANAELSAEAALHEAMGRRGLALMDTVALVTGYGRFGRALTRRLIALGARVWVGARREEQRLLAASDGANALKLDELHLVARRADVVLNTVPSQVFDERALAALPVRAPFLELASAPYGLPREEAARRAPYYEILPALPARYAPASAAKALFASARRLLPARP